MKQSPSNKFKQNIVVGDIPECYKLPSEEDGLVERLGLLQINKENSKSPDSCKSNSLVKTKSKIKLENLQILIPIYMEAHRINYIFNSIYQSKIFSYTNIKLMQKKADLILNKADKVKIKIEKTLYNLDYKIGKIIYGKIDK